jgi:hypothetical protein
MGQTKIQHLRVDSIDIIKDNPYVDLGLVHSRISLSVSQLERATPQSKVEGRSSLSSLLTLCSKSGENPFKLVSLSSSRDRLTLNYYQTRSIDR